MSLALIISACGPKTTPVVVSTATLSQPTQLPPERFDSVRRSISNFHRNQQEIIDLQNAEVAAAKARVVASGKREADKEIEQLLSLLLSK